ncbi:Ribosomal protein S11 [Rhizoctonia solani]|uniref:Ribosomal protein S11 n=1 Tax=Rhizoctonia solani TaxID=456999 RepID=A0A8H7IKZ3_9AGAM|nr:Ribosomal protein S11 [Rhizoctonia solani]
MKVLNSLGISGYALGLQREVHMRAGWAVGPSWRAILSSGDSEYTRQLRPGSTDQVYRMYVKSTSNNTIITLTDPEGNALKGGSASGGSVGFKGVARSGYEAGYQCALRIFNRISELKKTVNPALGDLKIELLLNGCWDRARGGLSCIDDTGRCATSSAG